MENKAQRRDVSQKGAEMELTGASYGEPVLSQLRKDSSNDHFSQSGRSEFPLIEGIVTGITPWNRVSQSFPWSINPLDHKKCFCGHKVLIKAALYFPFLDLHSALDMLKALIIPAATNPGTICLT